MAAEWWNVVFVSVFLQDSGFVLCLLDISSLDPPLHSFRLPSSSSSFLVVRHLLAVSSWFLALSSVIFQALTSLFIPFGFLPPLLFSLCCSPPACSFLLIWVGALSSLISFGFPPPLSSLANVTRIKSFLFATGVLNLV